MNTGRQDGLKVIAMLSMLIDHMGLLFFPDQLLWRQIGRLAFPLYAYFLAQGFEYTSSRRRYFFRLLLFGLISQLPFVYLNRGAELDLWQVNQVLLLLYSGLVLLVLEQAKKRKHWGSKLGIALVAIGLALVPEVLLFQFPQLSLSYASYGVLLSMLFYWFDGRWLPLSIGFFLLSWYYPYGMFARIVGEQFVSGFTNVRAIWELYRLVGDGYFSFSSFWLQNYALLALPVIYTGRAFPSEWRINRWLYYWFYPAHMVVLLGIYQLLG